MEREKPYQLEKDLVYVTGKTQYLEDRKVPTEKILRVTHISGTFEDIKNNEYVELGYWNGHAYVQLERDKPAVNGGTIHWNGNVWLREGQNIYAYFTNVANGEKMKLRAEGHWE